MRVPLRPCCKRAALPTRHTRIDARVGQPADPDDARGNLRTPDRAIATASATTSATVNGVKFVTREIVQTLPDDYRSAKRVRVASAAGVEPSILRQALEPAAAPKRAAVVAPVKFTPVARGPFAVQLGIFSSTANANHAWQHYTGKHSDLSAFARSTASLSAQGRNLHRLTANGFADEKTARAMCAKIRQSGDDCIIARAKY